LTSDVTESVQRALRAFCSYHATADPFSAMASACSALLAQAEYSGGRPDVSRLLRTVGAEVSRGDVDAVAQLTVSGDSYRLTVHSSLNRRRLNFAIAHELGHILLFEGVIDAGADLVSALTASHSVRILERLCDHAAGALLMPTDDFRSRVLAEPVSLSRLFELSDTYDVSPHAALARFVDVLTEVEVLLLHRSSTRRGTSQRYYVDSLIAAPVTAPMSASHLIGLRYLDTDQLHPDLLGRCWDTRRPEALASLRITRAGRDPIVRRAIAVPTRTTPTAQAPPSLRVYPAPPPRAAPPGFTTEGPAGIPESPGSIPAPQAIDIDYILICQKKAAPLAEWFALAGRRRVAHDKPTSAVHKRRPVPEMSLPLDSGELR